LGAGGQKITIPEWGLQFYIPPELPQGFAGLSYNNLCSASHNAPLGLLERYAKGTFPTSGGSIPFFVVTIGDYDYGYNSPQAYCTVDKTNHPEDRDYRILMGSIYSLQPIQ